MVETLSALVSKSKLQNFCESLNISKKTHMVKDHKDLNLLQVGFQDLCLDSKKHMDPLINLHYSNKLGNDWWLGMKLRIRKLPDMDQRTYGSNTLQLSHSLSSASIHSDKQQKDLQNSHLGIHKSLLHFCRDNLHLHHIV